MHILSRPKMPISKGKMTAKKMAIPKKTFSVICAKSCESSSSPIFDRFCSKLMCLEERNKTKRVARVLRGRTKSIHAVQHPVLFAHQNFKKFLANGQRQRVVRFWVIICIRSHAQHMKSMWTLNQLMIELHHHMSRHLQTSCKFLFR